MHSNSLILLLCIGLFYILLNVHAAQKGKHHGHKGTTTDEQNVEEGGAGQPVEKKKGWGHIKQGVEKVHGTMKHKGKKQGKKQKFKNQKTYVWKGKMVHMAGPDANDIAPQHADISEAVQFGQACKDAAHTHTENGPVADGALQDHFQPCQERKRGGRKRGRWANQEQPSRSERRKRSETYSSINLLWPDPDKIPIMFDVSYPESRRANVRQAWQFWQNNTCLKFVEKPTGTRMSEPHILLKLTGRGSCSTDRLGPMKTPPYSTIIDTTQCYNLTGSVAHEIGHALGLAHSQKRVDRDGAVDVNMLNIAPSWRSQFDKNNDKLFDEWGIPYFYDSIMHYFPYASSTNGLMTICPLDPIMESVMGQREEPAFGDIALINRIYCQESCFYKNELPNLNFNGNLSMTISGRNCQSWSSQTPQKHKFASLGNHEYCRSPDKWAGGPWCYTKDPAVPYEPCFSSCENLEKLHRSYCHGWCYNGGYHSPFNCECVCPRFASGRFCENSNPSLKYKHISCGTVIDLQRGVPKQINSPNWPANYGVDTLCVWWIKAPEGMRVQATIDDFFVEIPDDNGCYDYVEIRKSLCAATRDHPENMRYCGNSLAPNPSPKTIISEDKNMVVKFFSDDQGGAKGFSITLKAV